MKIQEEILKNMVSAATQALIPYFKKEGANDTVILNMLEGLRVFLNFRACDEATSYTLKIDRWPVSPELQRVFDKAHYGGADFGNGFWLEVKLDFLKEVVTIKQNQTEEEKILYQSENKVIFA